VNPTRWLGLLHPLDIVLAKAGLAALNNTNPAEENAWLAFNIEAAPLAASTEAKPMHTREPPAAVRLRMEAAGGSRK
jgi:hypothetical protein